MFGSFNKVVISFIAAAIATPVLAQAPNFGTLKLSAGFPPGQGQASGRTGGAYSLSSIANKDRNGNACIGYGAQTPDHIIVLESKFSQLNVQINSGGKDTTMVMKGPNNLVICGDDTGSSKDASITATNLPPGEYRIWVGTVQEGQRGNYALTIRQ